MLYVLEHCVYIGSLDRDENLGDCGNGARGVIMEEREFDSKE